MAGGASGPATTRLDKWLWHARFFKTRTLAAQIVQGGHVRVNSAKVAKAAHAVGPGDTLTFAQADQIRVIRVLALADRRGPAAEARGLYDDLDPLPRPGSDPDPKPPGKAPGFDGGRFETGGRPSKKDRRIYDQSRGYDRE